jgi:hypothetical protein
MVFKKGRIKIPPSIVANVPNTGPKIKTFKSLKKPGK